MTLVDQVRQVLDQGLLQADALPEFRDLQAFYTRMKEAGLLVKQEYELPPLDTVGRSVYRITKS